MKKQVYNDDSLRQGWEALGRQVSDSQMFTDAQLAGLYKKASLMQPAECPMLPRDPRVVATSRLRTLALAVVVVLVVSLLPRPWFVINDTSSDHMAEVATIASLMAEMNC